MARPKTFAATIKGSPFAEGLVDVLGPVETSRGRKTKTWGVAFAVRSDWLVQLGPEPLVDGASDTILVHHRDSIRAGVRTDTGAKQPALKRRGKFADKDRQSQTRGFRDGDFADHIMRGKISVSGPKFSPSNGVTGAKLSFRRGKSRPFATRARASIGAVDLGKTRDARGNAADYVSFVANEFDARGVDYFHVAGNMSDKLDAWLRAYMDGAIEGLAEAPTDGDVPAKSV